MRKLPLLFVLLLLSALAAAPAAQAASPLSPADLVSPFLAASEEEEAEEAEAEEEEWEEEELCEPEEEEFCEEEEPAGKSKAKGKAKGDECPLKGAKAAVSVNPGKRRLRLTVHYRTWQPATVSVATSLAGPKGALHLGTDHARFRRSGVYRDTFVLAEKQTKKALAANEFTVELHVVNAPPSCGLELSGASPRAKR